MKQQSKGENMDKESIVKAEYAAAKQEGRQPRCPYCQSDLIVQQISRHKTSWQQEGKRFEKHTSVETSPPRCMICKVIDWNFIDNDFVKLCDPLPLFALTEEDAQIMAEQIEIEPLTDDQMRRVRKGVESGIEGWSDALEAAIREAVRT